MSTPRAQLRRTLGLWDLVLYGVIVIQPTAPMPVFGVLSNRGRGHVVTTILIAMVAMLFTAISYGRMGWSMVMDYMLNPLICIIWISQQAHVFAPGVPYWTWAIAFAVLFTWLNLQGVRTSARMNAGLAAAMEVVIAIFFVCAARYIFGHPHAGMGFFTRPLYGPAAFSPGAVLGSTSIAVLTCVAIGALSALEVYAAQLAWPASQSFPDETTAFVYAAGRSFFGMVDPKQGVPRNNVVFVAAALVRYYVREPVKRLWNLIPAAIGFAVCLLLWLNLSRTAQFAGAVWMAAGIAFGAWKTHGFRGELVNFEIPSEDEA